MADLGLYQCFYEVAKHKSLSKAASALFITQPAVTLKIKALENQLATTLFVRNSRGVSLTNEGEILLQYVEQALDLINAGEIALTKIKNLDIGTISIGASDTICKFYLLDKIANFKKNHENINLLITNNPTNETIELLKTGKVDIAFANLPVNDEAFEVSECLEIEDIFVASPEFAFLNEGKTISVKELNKHHLCLS